MKCSTHFATPDRLPMELRKITNRPFSLLIAAVISFSSGCSTKIAPAIPQSPTVDHQLALVAQYPSPVLSVTSPGAENVTYGFEDGRVIKIGITYHLIIAEFIENSLDPAARFTRSNIAHWMSVDRIHWTRVGTLFASTGDRSGMEIHSLCGGFPVLD